jgi:putative ABC transport system substrate-binding protein
MAILGGAVAWPPSAWPQQSRRVLGMLTLTTPTNPVLQSFQDALHDLGWVEGQNLAVVFRGGANVQRLPEMAAELVRSNVDIIFAPTPIQVEAARQATQTIPIVFASHGDPVGVGHVASLARPGGNITGISNLLTDLVAKDLEVLKEALPKATRVGVLWNPTSLSHLHALKSIENAAGRLGIQVQLLAARTAEEIDGALAEMARAGLTAVLVVLSPISFNERVRLAEGALRHRLASVFASRENVQAGGLISYGTETADGFRRAAAYVDKILRGAKPGDLAVEQASKFEMIINLKTAQALGITMPSTLVARADEVIE